MIIRNGYPTNKIVIEAVLPSVENLEYYRVKKTSIYKAAGVKGDGKNETNRN